MNITKPARSIVEVEGLDEHRENVAEFCIAVSEAAARRRHFGVELTREASGFKVHGVVAGRSLLLGRLPGVPSTRLPSHAAIHKITISRHGTIRIMLALDHDKA